MKPNYQAWILADGEPVTYYEAYEVSEIEAKRAMAAFLKHHPFHIGAKYSVKFLQRPPILLTGHDPDARLTEEDMKRLIAELDEEWKKRKVAE